MSHSLGKLSFCFFCFCFFPEELNSVRTSFSIVEKWEVQAGSEVLSCVYILGLPSYFRLYLHNCLLARDVSSSVSGRWQEKSRNILFVCNSHDKWWPLPRSLQIRVWLLRQRKTWGSNCFWFLLSSPEQSFICCIYTPSARSLLNSKERKISHRNSCVQYTASYLGWIARNGKVSISFVFILDSCKKLPFVNKGSLVSNSFD